MYTFAMMQVTVYQSLIAFKQVQWSISECSYMELASADLCVLGLTDYKEEKIADSWLSACASKKNLSGFN